MHFALSDANLLGIDLLGTDLDLLDIDYFPAQADWERESYRSAGSLEGARNPPVGSKSAVPENLFRV